jgi:hypothetical protein
VTPCLLYNQFLQAAHVISVSHIILLIGSKLVVKAIIQTNLLKKVSIQLVPVIVSQKSISDMDLLVSKVTSYATNKTLQSYRAISKLDPK